MSKMAEEYHKEFDALYGGHEPNLSLSKVELAASEAAYGWQSDKEGHLTLEMFPEVFKRGFLQGYELAEKDLADVAAFSSGPDGFYYGKGYQQGKKDAEKHLGWHSVEESLPPVDEEVIVLRNESNGITLPYPYNLTYGHIVDQNIAIDYNGWDIPGVKYWMPMPKLPEEK